MRTPLIPYEIQKRIEEEIEAGAKRAYLRILRKSTDPKEERLAEEDRHAVAVAEAMAGTKEGPLRKYDLH